MLYEIFNAGRFISRGKGEHPTRVIDSDELIFVIHGELDMFEADFQFNVCQGEWLILHRGRRHGGRALYPKNLSFFWLHFRDLDGFLKEIPQHGKAEFPSQIGGYFQNFLNEQNRIKPERRIQDLLFRLIFEELHRDRVPEKSRTPLAVAAKNYIDLNFTEQINLQTTAMVLRCNGEYLGRLFHECYEETFVSYLNRKRIEKAAFYLANDTLSIKETALLCGFNDLAYFRRKFYFYYNQTPGDFRKSNSGGHRNSF